MKSITVISLCLLVALCSSCGDDPVVRERARQLNDRAVALMLTNMDSALILLHESINTDSTYYLAHSNLGVAHLQRKDTTTAIVYLKRAMELEPQLAELAQMTGIILHQSGDSAGARAALLHALRVYDDRIARSDSNLMANRLNRANVLGALGQHETASSELSALFVDFPADSARIAASWTDWLKVRQSR